MTDFGSLAQFFSAIRPQSTNHDLIRIGGESDGGYLIPNDLAGVEICFSPGVSTTADFEFELASRGIRCFLADYSVNASPIKHDLVHFEKKYLGYTEESPYITLESWVKRMAPTKHDFILQMDIEGDEYGVIFDTSRDTLRKFRIMLIEFHGLDALCDKFGFKLINLTFKKLLFDFDVVHIHPNNTQKPTVYGKYEIPPVVEFTFLRKDRISGSRPAANFPHRLDRKNTPTRDEMILPRCWYE
jgi:hypothetical protein